MNISEYPFSKFIGIDISKDKIDIAELKGAAGKTIGNNKKEICRWIKSLKETCQTIVVMEATGGYEAMLVKLQKTAGTHHDCIERHGGFKFPVDDRAERAAREFSAAARGARNFPVAGWPFRCNRHNSRSREVHAPAQQPTH